MENLETSKTLTKISVATGELNVADSSLLTKAGLIIKALRVSQWTKNVLLFVPLIVSHKFLQPSLLLNVIYAFVAFSLCASTGYLINDWFDRVADREHPRKKHRPFASGALSFKIGVIAVGLLLPISFGLALWFLPPLFSAVLLLYLIVTIAYSLSLKTQATIDVLTLAVLYALRIFAGGLAVNIEPSTWLLAFSIFLFLSLAILKRYAELRFLQLEGKVNNFRRGYYTGDAELLKSLGAASGYLSVLVLALYINSDEVRLLYNHPKFLWMICLLLLYWITNLWLLAHRGVVDDDPLVFALRDARSYAIGALCLLVILVAGI